MKASVKRALDTLEAYGFHSEPHPYKRATSIHWHENQPDVRLAIFAGMSDAAASKAVRQAEAVIGLAQTESEKATATSENTQTKNRRQKAAQEKRNADAKRRADEKEADARAAQHRQFAKRFERGELTASDMSVILRQSGLEWISPDRIIDDLSLSPRRVRGAIANGHLETYRRGPKVLCKTSEVGAWVHAGLPWAAGTRQATA